jgi:hypothetical protein
MLFQKLLTASPPRVRFLGMYSSTTGATSYTFNSVDFGPEGDRTIVVATHGSATPTAVCSSISIAGTNGNLFAGASSSLTQGIASRLVTTGTSGTVVVTFSATRTNGCAIGVYALYGLASSTRTAGLQDAISNSPASVTLSSSGPGHVLIACLGTGADPFSDMSFTGVQQDGQALLVSPRTVFAASNQSSSASSNTVSASWSGTANARLIVTSYN